MLIHDHCNRWGYDRFQITFKVTLNGEFRRISDTHLEWKIRASDIFGDKSQVA
jgi:hypothetical protein